MLWRTTAGEVVEQTATGTARDRELWAAFHAGDGALFPVTNDPADDYDESTPEG